MIDLCQQCKQKNKIFLGQVIYLPKGNHPEHKDIFALRRKGKSANEIARAYGITSRRVWQILSSASN